MSTTQKLLQRGGLLAALLALTLALAVPAASAAPPEEATAWLSEQLKTEAPGEYCELFGSKSVAQTIDCMLAFDAAGSAFNAERAATYSWILANKKSLVGEKSCQEGSASLSAAAVAKLAVAVLSQGGNPKNVGGRDLISDLECLQVTAAGEEQGRFKDIGGFEDFSNVFGQSLAVIALRSCSLYCPGTPALTNPIKWGAAYLRGQQCEGEEEVLGAFRSPLGRQAGECNAEPPFPESGVNLDAVEADSTAVAVQALLVDGTGESGAAATAALGWLEGALVAEEPPFWQGYCDFTASETIFPSVNGTALGVMAYAKAAKATTPMREWLEATVTTLAGNGMPGCGAGAAEEEGDMIATGQGILGLYATSYPALVGL